MSELINPFREILRAVRAVISESSSSPATADIRARQQAIDERLQEIEAGRVASRNEALRVRLRTILLHPAATADLSLAIDLAADLTLSEKRAIATLVAAAEAKSAIRN